MQHLQDIPPDINTVLATLPQHLSGIKKTVVDRFPDQQVEPSPAVHHVLFTEWTNRRPSPEPGYDLKRLGTCTVDEEDQHMYAPPHRPTPH